MAEYPDIQLIVVDDEERSLQEIKKILIQADLFSLYHLHFFKKPFDVLSYLNENPASILISDFSMPGMTGDILIELCRKKVSNIKTVLLMDSKSYSVFEKTEKKENMADEVLEKDHFAGNLISIITGFCQSPDLPVYSLKES